MAIITGDSGNNTLNNLLENDTIEGGGGSDTAVYNGSAADYQISFINGIWTIMDTNQADGNDGLDTLRNIEQLQFADRTYNLVPSTGETQVNTTTTNEQQGAKIAVLTDGGWVVTWHSQAQDGSGWGVYGQRYDSTGMAIGDEFRINTTTANNQSTPAVAALVDGGFLVAWNSDGNQDGSNNGIYAQRYDVTGAAVGSEFLVNTYTNDHQANPSVTGLANGGFVLTWQSAWQDGSYNGVYGQIYNAAGAKVGGEFRPHTNTSYEQQNSKVTALSSGGFLVSWQDSEQDSSSWGVYGRLYDASGTAIGTNEFCINTTTSDQQGDVSIAALGTGFVAVWNSINQDGSTWGIYGQRYNGSGDKLGTEFRINSQVYDSQYIPSVTNLNGGGFVVTWQGYSQDGSGWGIYSQRFNDSGNKVGTEFRVNTYTTSEQISSSETSISR